MLSCPKAIQFKCVTQQDKGEYCALVGGGETRTVGVISSSTEIDVKLSD